MRTRMIAVLAAAVLVLASTEPVAVERACRDALSSRKCNCGSCRLQRAGNSHTVSWLARPSNTHRYWGYYVGGGAAFKGESRQRHEGVWGWDYFGGGWFNRRVSLGWWHGARRQGGRGAYKPDGPKIFHKE